MRVLFLSGGFLAAAILLAGCAAPPPPPPPPSNPGGPTIAFMLPHPGKVGSLTYRAADKQTVALSVVADDPGGVTELSVAFSPTVAGCTLILDGSTSKAPSRYTPTLPAQGKKFAPADSHASLTVAIHGPFFCVDPAGHQTGYPWGQTITLTVRAVDSAGHQNTAKLPIRLVDRGK
jgi:hypothetical protein